MSAQTQTAGRKRLVHQLDTPFSTTPWPEISADDQDAILELLCSFLSPIGQHRRTHVQRSKGKRAAKKEKKAAAAADPSESSRSDAAARAVQEQLGSSIDVGFNSITRTLQSQSAITSSRTPEEQSKPRSKDEDEDEDEASSAYSMVFVARGNQSSAFNCHFPQMIGSASLAQPADRRLRLVGFSKPCSDRLGGALGLPRVSSVAVKSGAPGADALLAFVRQKVGPVSVPWLEGGQRLDYRTTRVKSTETTVGVKRVKQA